MASRRFTSDLFGYRTRVVHDGGNINIGSGSGGVKFMNVASISSASFTSPGLHRFFLRDTFTSGTVFLQVVNSGTQLIGAQIVSQSYQGLLSGTTQTTPPFVDVQLFSGSLSGSNSVNPQNNITLNWLAMYRNSSGV